LIIRLWYALPMLIAEKAAVAGEAGTAGHRGEVWPPATCICMVSADQSACRCRRICLHTLQSAYPCEPCLYPVLFEALCYRIADAAIYDFERSTNCRPNVLDWNTIA
jgi:hypothetical protein